MRRLPAPGLCLRTVSTIETKAAYFLTNLWLSAGAENAMNRMNGQFCSHLIPFWKLLIFMNGIIGAVFGAGVR